MRKKVLKIFKLVFVFLFIFISSLYAKNENRKVSFRSGEKISLKKVKLEGKTEEAVISKSECLYTEWLYGIKNSKGEWVEYSTGYRSESPLFLRTPQGLIEVSTFSLRPYLAPISTKLFFENNLEEAPQPVRDKINEKKVPILAEEYCLKSDQYYFVQFKKEERSKTLNSSNQLLILISDLPFKKNRPQRVLTPLYQQMDY